ncbi:MAG: CHAT domain-containing protein [Treponemataceae bacterium]
MIENRINDLKWSDDILVLDSDMTPDQAIKKIKAENREWIVIREFSDKALFALSCNEMLDRVSSRAGKTVKRATLATALGLTASDRSRRVASRTDDLIIPRREPSRAPSASRFVLVDETGLPKAVGYLPSAMPKTMPAAIWGRHRIEPTIGFAFKRKTASKMRPEADSSDRMDEVKYLSAELSAPPFRDEGIFPVRFPSIDAETTLAPGVRAVFVIDLLREKSASTTGAGLSIPALDDSWTSLELTVILTSVQVDFENEGRSTIVIRRNEPSAPAKIAGTVKRGASPVEPVYVSAIFLHGTRFCGSAERAFRFSSQQGTTISDMNATGLIAVEPAAIAPDVTVRISRLQTGLGTLDWIFETARFEGLPSALREQIDLGRDVAEEATGILEELASLPRAKHRASIEGFGERLWRLAPKSFRDAYWAVWDNRRKPFSIQFICNEPNIPWELMRPVRPDESEIHPPLAIMHPVGRWIERFEGDMRNSLAAGNIVTIAPHYKSVSIRLPRAEAESKELERRFGAVSIAGTIAAVTELLENPPEEPVAIVHFAGHGDFAWTSATASSITLEDGSLSAREIERSEVKLGRKHHSLVFLNACETGSTGSVFGQVGGWADAFLGRKFGGFIAPLWAVDDKDAQTVAVELLENILERKLPIGEVLMSIRAKHGDESPTFYSYLYYGDVTARLSE